LDTRLYYSKDPATLGIILQRSTRRQAARIANHSSDARILSYEQAGAKCAQLQYPQLSEERISWPLMSGGGSC
jgi:hypothetical protein